MSLQDFIKRWGKEGASLLLEAAAEVLRDQELHVRANNLEQIAKDLRKLLK